MSRNPARTEAESPEPKSQSPEPRAFLSKIYLRSVWCGPLEVPLMRLTARTGGALLVVFFVSAGSAWAQGGTGGGQAAAPPKNLQILKPQEVGPAMRAFAFGLGVQCGYCHVMEPTRDMASDEKQTKK